MLGPILSAFALAEVKRRAERAVRNATLSAAAGFCLLVAASFVVGAILIALMRVMDPVWACLIVAAAFVLAAAGFWIVRRLGRSRRRSMAGAGMLGAVGGGAAAAAVSEPRPATDRRREPHWLPSNRLVLILPAVAFVAAAAAGRWWRSGDR